MGFYYFIILFLGVLLILGAGSQAIKHKTLSNKRGIFFGGIGVLLIGLAIFLFTPDSSDIMAELLGMNE